MQAVREVAEGVKQLLLHGMLYIHRPAERRNGTPCCASARADGSYRGQRAPYRREQMFLSDIYI